MELAEAFQRMGVALGLGLLIGLQRERVGSRLAGIRTFSLTAILGALCAAAGEWAVGAGLVALAALVVAGFLHKQDTDPGLTTEVALLVMFGLGAAAMLGPLPLVIAAGGVVAVLLHLKEQLHGFVAKLGDQELKAIMQFVVVSLVILPALPNKYFGPYNVLNPQRLWLTVVLIVGISLAGFLIYRWFGQRAGSLAAGILGGLISSTATTVSYSRRAKSEPSAARLASVIIMIASTVVFARVMVIVGATAPNFLHAAAPPLAIVLVAATVVSLFLWKKVAAAEKGMPDQGNPAEVRAALFFVGIYALVLIAVAFAKERLGSSGLYAVAILSGLTDMDAITLSVSQMVHDNRLNPSEAWRMILAAGISNLVFKAAIVSTLGPRQLLKPIALAFALTAAAAVAVIFLWPA